MEHLTASLNSENSICSSCLHVTHLNVILFLVMPLSFMQLYDSGNRKIHRRHSTGDFPFRHTVMYNWRIPIQIIHKAIYLQHPLPEITILSILSTELSQVVEGLKPNLQDVTCKFEGSSFAPLSVHLSVYFNIKCSLSCNVISYFSKAVLDMAWLQTDKSTNTCLLCRRAAWRAPLYWLWIALLKYMV